MDNQIENSTIHSYARACVLRFQVLMDHSNKELLDFEDQFARFKIWAANIGVFAEAHASLDYRVRNNAKAKEMVLLILRNLKRKLQRALDVYNPQGQLEDDYSGYVQSGTIQDSSESLSSSGSSVQRLPLTSGAKSVKDVEIAINRLHRLSMSIRGSSTHKRKLTGLDFALLDENGEDYTQTFVDFALRVTETRFPRAIPSLHNRLAELIVQRRKNIAYQQRHQQKLGQISKTEGHTSLVKGLLKRSPDYRDLTAGRPLQRPDVSLNHVDAPGRHKALSTTTATALTQQTLLSRPAPSELSSSAVSLGPGPKTIDFPHPPKLSPGSKEFQCPYCGHILTETTSHFQKWRKHIINDLEPYVCLFEECNSENKCFRSTEEWKKHMEVHTLRWYCGVGSCKADMFTSQSLFEGHMEKFHPGTYSASQMSLLVERMRRPKAEIFECCPLCTFVPGERQIEADSGAANLELIKHIASHLEELALMSLPWNDNDEVDIPSNRISNVEMERSTANLDLEPQADFQSLTFEDPPRFSDSQSLQVDEVGSAEPNDTSFDQNSTAEWVFILPLNYAGHLKDPKLESFINRQLYSEYVLKEILEEEEQPCATRTQDVFIPCGKLSELITIATVTRDILARDPTISYATAHEHAERVCGIETPAKRLYATLAHIKKGPDICGLLNEGVSDVDLPFIISARSSEVLRKDGRRINTMQHWKKKHLDNFNRVQFQMTATEFTFLEFHDIDKNAILPFLKLDPEESSLPRQGGYSTVFPVRIHPQHHDFWDLADEPEPLVAVKQLNSLLESEFRKEELILKTIGRKNHPHLIKLLATYKQFDHYHLLFLFADANLRGYWENHPVPEFNASTLLWSLHQMTGIASALQIIHNFRTNIPPETGNQLKSEGGAKSTTRFPAKQGEELYGRHGDIKPENFLWFAVDSSVNKYVGGILQLADFGLGRFHGRDSRSGTAPENARATSTYEPPECRLRRPVSRAYDLWSLGCVLLEFVTWLLKGSAEIYEFSDRRGHVNESTGIDGDSFYTILKDSKGREIPIVNEKVSEWVEQLHADDKCSQMIHDLLDCIMTGLLVTDATRRRNAEWLSGLLSIYLQHAESTPDYLLKPSARRRAHVGSVSLPKEVQESNIMEPLSWTTPKNFRSRTF